MQSFEYELCVIYIFHTSVELYLSSYESKKYMSCGHWEHGECLYTTLPFLPLFTFNLQVSPPLLVSHPEISIKPRILLN